MFYVVFVIRKVDLVWFVWKNMCIYEKYIVFVVVYGGCSELVFN